MLQGALFPLRSTLSSKDAAKLQKILHSAKSLRHILFYLALGTSGANLFSKGDSPKVAS